MAASFRTVLRTAIAQTIISDAGATGAKMKFYNGPLPVGVNPISGGNTKLAEVVWVSGPIGIAVAGGLELLEDTITQNNTQNVAGTPTFVHITTSADVIVARIDIVGPGQVWAFTGNIAVGRNITLFPGLIMTTGNI